MKRRVQSTATGLALVLSLAGGHAYADPAWSALDDAALSELRGGIRSDNGVTISFAIDSQALIDGVVAQSRSVAAALATGPDGRLTVVSQTAGVGVFGTLVQNSADRQRIQTFTSIDAVVNSLSVLRTLELQRLLSRQLSTAFH